MALTLLFLKQLVAGSGAGHQQSKALLGNIGIRGRLCPPHGVSRRGDSTLCRLPVPTEKESWLENPGRRATHLPVGCWDETQELIDVTHEEPVREEPHWGLHLLGAQEVLQGLMHVSALAAVLTERRSYDSHQHHQKIQ